MRAESDLKEVSISIPSLLLSSRISTDGSVEKHLLTPFGSIEIAYEGLNEDSGFELRVTGGIDTWMLDQALPEQFRVSLLSFFREILRSHCETPLLERGEISLHLENGSPVLRIIWED